MPQVCRLIGVVMIIWGAIDLGLSYLWYRHQRSAFLDLYAQAVPPVEGDTFFIPVNWLEPCSILLTGVVLFVASRLISRVVGR